MDEGFEELFGTTNLWLENIIPWIDEPVDDSDPFVIIEPTLVKEDTFRGFLSVTEEYRYPFILFVQERQIETVPAIEIGRLTVMNSVQRRRRSKWLDVGSAYTCVFWCGDRIDVKLPENEHDIDSYEDLSDTQIDRVLAEFKIPMEKLKDKINAGDLH